MDGKPKNVIDVFIQDIIEGPQGWDAYVEREYIYSANLHMAIAAWVIRSLANIENPQSGLVMEAIRRERQRRIGQTSYKRIRKLATK